MEVNEQLIRAITEAVVAKMKGTQEEERWSAQMDQGHAVTDRTSSSAESSVFLNPSPQKKNALSGKTRMRPKHSYAGARKAEKGTNPREVVIGVGAAFQTEILQTISGIPLDEVLQNIRAGIEEEGMVSRVVKVLDTSDVGFMGLQSAKLSGSGIGIGLQSKGTAVIHQKDLYPLSNLELFPQAPLMDLATYRAIGKNAARYVKGERVTPIECTNDPMVRAKYQVKAALMHIMETEQLEPSLGMIEWGDAR